MNKLLVGLMLILGITGACQAQIINLACQGNFTGLGTPKNSSIKLTPSSGYNYFNVQLNIGTQQLTIGNSEWFSSNTYGLTQNESIYMTSINQPQETTTFVINRYTGKFTFDQTQWLSSRKDSSLLYHKSTGEGFCELGKSWNPKF